MSAIRHHQQAGFGLLRRSVAAVFVTVLAPAAFTAFILAWFALALILGRYF